MKCEREEPICGVWASGSALTARSILPLRTAQYSQIINTGFSGHPLHLSEKALGARNTEPTTAERSARDTSRTRADETHEDSALSWL